eukprot:scaffold2179_cov165-Amphora_coffeaeformis.AAC.1
MPSLHRNGMLLGKTHVLRGSMISCGVSKAESSIGRRHAVDSKAQPAFIPSLGAMKGSPGRRQPEKDTLSRVPAAARHMQDHKVSSTQFG